MQNFWRNKAQAEVYLSLNDPHSFMLVQMLSRLANNYQIDIKVLFIWGTLPGVTLCPKLYRQWAINDANLDAEQYQLVKITQEPSLASLATGQQMWQFSNCTIDCAEQIFIKTWGNQYTEFFQTSTPTINHQVKNQIRLQTKGHYAPASIFFAGHWFVGVNRLYHFEDLLRKLGLLRQVTPQLWPPQLAETNCTVERLAPVIEMPKSIKLNKQTKTLTVYLSLRSPYSYLGLVQAIALAERKQLELVIKPILLLMMRGAEIPLNKQKYIYLDAVREAVKHGIEFNGFTDPLRAGVINVYRLFAWAEFNGQACNYMLACFRAVYVNEIDLSKSNNIAAIYAELALNIKDAEAYQATHDWQQWADMNQADLAEINFWGVPSFSFAQYSYWGQDRIPYLENTINELNDPCQPT